MSDYRSLIVFLGFALATLAFGIYQDVTLTRRKVQPDFMGMKPGGAGAQGQVGNVRWSFGKGEKAPN